MPNTYGDLLKQVEILKSVIADLELKKETDLAMMLAHNTNTFLHTLMVDFQLQKDKDMQYKNLGDDRRNIFKILIPNG